MTVAVVDWGVGALQVASVLARRPERPDLLVDMDPLDRPYGLQPPERLTRVLRQRIAQVRALGAAEVWVACHSASTVLDAWVDGGPVRGMIDPAVVPEGGEVLVVGGKRTIDSGAWRRALVGRRVEERVAQPWSALVEAGRRDGPEVDAALRDVLVGSEAPLVVLACTHYPALLPALTALYPTRRFVDPGRQIAEQAAVPPGQGRLVVRTSGGPAAAQGELQRLGLRGSVVGRPTCG